MTMSDPDWKEITKLAGHDEGVEKVCFTVKQTDDHLYVVTTRGLGQWTKVKGKNDTLDRIKKAFINERPDRGRFFLTREEAWYGDELEGKIIFWNSDQ